MKYTVEQFANVISFATTTNKETKPEKNTGEKIKTSSKRKGKGDKE